MEYLVFVALMVGGAIGILDATIQKRKDKKSRKQKKDSLDDQENVVEDKEMRLSEFVKNYNSEEQIRILENEEVIYEGKVGKLRKLLEYNVHRSSGKVVDGITQIEIGISDY